MDRLVIIFAVGVGTGQCILPGDFDQMAERTYLSDLTYLE
jgi:hypothetical protein